MDDELITVIHCEKVVCHSTPSICPLCGKDIDYRVIPPPSYLPNPMVNAHAKRHRLSVVIKPTIGTWANAVKSENDLHIGITDFDGAVANYFWSGVERSTVGWENSLVAYHVSSSDINQWDHVWTSVLDDMELDISWSPDYYEENEHNCFDFVLEFLKTFCLEVERRCGFVGGLDFFNDKFKDPIKQAFVDAYVLPKISEVQKYIDFDDNVKKAGYAKVS